MRRREEEGRVPDNKGGGRIPEIMNSQCSQASAEKKNSRWRRWWGWKKMERKGIVEVHRVHVTEGTWVPEQPLCWRAIK